MFKKLVVAGSVSAMLCFGASVQAQTNGVVRIDTGRKGPVSDALDGKKVGDGPAVELNLEAGEVRVLRY